ncbi:Cas10/Cmr2 second palm domain-containing protein [Oxynema aestuarii]|uniref:CRISPR-associated protein Cmr2 n=1 Tax=Oxynema aestuarii AP17 TaxID=2064643 RepID=A0A6H1TZP6_9CYAN|nr:type III-B CRISPR-associated protein Cas10/Cmr2 [Oxynema aestuarii]QIZ71666.1 CRISPR-associated protein Cmr2 [Oxynema aestuarii AP17]
MTEYTAITFAPVQGFIEKSRKLRDLYGASIVLSYLSSKLVESALSQGLEVISPGLPNLQKGMPNRILIKGKFERNDVEKVLLDEWKKVLVICREWIEENLGFPKDNYSWSQTEEQKGKQKGEWERWESYTWEIFWGHGNSVDRAMEDLETRKLKRGWTGINWMGESSSLTGTDAIAWHQLGRTLEKGEDPGRSLTPEEKDALELFYRRLSWLLDNPDYRVGKPHLSLQQLRDYEESKPEEIGKYIAPNERLSIPELVKRLVTYDAIADEIDMVKLKPTKNDPEFKDINRNAGYWTAWFMGDGDKVGDKLQILATRNPDNLEEGDRNLKTFTDLMRNWGKEFEKQSDSFTAGEMRVIYAGGDDFLGVLYSKESKNQENALKIKPSDAFEWLRKLPIYWEQLQKDIDDRLKLQFTFSVGFVWAGHQVPQRDILQHCREAEKRAKSLGRDRVTIRVVFNSGQYVQWTCPWDYLDILTKYRDRNQKTGAEANWNHIYSDWAQLKARHAIRLQTTENNPIVKDIALSLFDLYFDNAADRFRKQRKWVYLTGKIDDETIVKWLDDLIEIGWQLCRSSSI